MTGEHRIVFEDGVAGYIIETKYRADLRII